MPQVSVREFQGLPLRVHGFLAGVPLHDAWAIDLPHWRPGITLDEFLRVPGDRSCRLSPGASMLFKARLFVGRLLGWDREPEGAARDSFATRLTPADLASSLLPPGTPDSLFRVVYRFQNESLLEVINRTAHGGALSALIETADSYRFYFAVYVRNVSWVTPLYMALIHPFRKWVVYPSILRTIRARWDRAFGNVTK